MLGVITIYKRGQFYGHYKNITFDGFCKRTITLIFTFSAALIAIFLWAARQRRLRCGVLAFSCGEYAPAMLSLYSDMADYALLAAVDENAADTEALVLKLLFVLDPFRLLMETLYFCGLRR